MDVTLNTEALLEKRTIFEQDLIKKSMRIFLTNSLIICALGVFVMILARMEIIELYGNAGTGFILAIFILGLMRLYDKTVKIVRFYEDELGLTNQRTKL